MMDEIRKVLIATPSYDGKVDVWYTDSLVNSIRIAQANNIFLHPVFMSYDSLIQRARNDLFKLAVDNGYDDMIFIDSDMDWNPEWILDLLNYPEDVVGGTARKKTDEAELYAVKLTDLEAKENGLFKCEGLGTGFVKLSRAAFTALWEASPEYTNGERSGRMVCNVQIIDGEFMSEDIILFRKLNDLGFDCWLDPKMTCGHTGVKRFLGDISSFIDRARQQKSSNG